MKTSAVSGMIASGLAVVLMAGAASAQNAPAAGEAAGEAGGEVQATVENRGGRRVYVASTTIEIEGEIQRPYAFSLSGRSSLGYSYLEAPVHFLQEIINAVRRAPF